MGRTQRARRVGPGDVGVLVAVLDVPAIIDRQEIGRFGRRTRDQIIPVEEVRERDVQGTEALLPRRFVKNRQIAGQASIEPAASKPLKRVTDDGRSKDERRCVRTWVALGH